MFFSESGQVSAKGNAGGKGKGQVPISIPVDELSPKFKELVVVEMVKGGKANIIKVKKSK